MNKLLFTVAAGALLLAAPVMAQEATTTTASMLSGPGVTCGPTTASTTGTTTDTTASTTDTTGTTTTDTTGTTTGTETTASTTGTTSATGAASGSSTMALSADNQVDAQTARTALTNAQANLDKFSALTTKPTVVCLVDLEVLSASDTMLKDDITKFQGNTAQIKSKFEADTALIDTIKAQHPTFDINTVKAFDIGPSGELVLYISRS
jgi:hypothetical protein